jgi:Stage II sporulation protein E (SpoIIE)
VITRALGTDPDVDVDTFSIETVTGDVFMLCSDGLTSMVEDDVILQTVEKNRDNLQGAAKALIRAANKGGGEDNITVVFFEIGDDVGEPLEETAQYPTLGADAGNGEVDEDTLDELDRVPAIDTMVVPPGEVEQAVKPKRRTRGRLIPALLLILVALAVIAVVLWTLHGR